MLFRSSARHLPAVYSSKMNFIVSELWSLSWGASVQRAHLFSKTSSEKRRRSFRERVIQFVDNEILPEYASSVSEERHYLNIKTVSDHAAVLDYDAVLPQGRYKIGVAQKLLNLQLKYLWCLDLVAEPPHCPIDRVIIDKTQLRGTVAWTRIVDMEEYQRVIAALKEVVQPTGLSLARWELMNYDRADALV